MGDLRALSSLAMAKAVISLTISLALLVVQCSSSPVWVQKKLPTTSRCQKLCPECKDPTCKCTDSCWPGSSLQDTPDKTCDCFAQLGFCKAGEKPVYTPGKECPSCWPPENKACMCFAAIGFCEPPKRLPETSRCKQLCPGCNDPKCKCPKGACWPGHSLNQTSDHNCDCFAELGFCKAGEEPVYTPGKKCPSCWPAENKACMCFAALGFCKDTPLLGAPDAGNITIHKMLQDECAEATLDGSVAGYASKLPGVKTGNCASEGFFLPLPPTQSDFWNVPVLGAVAIHKFTKPFEPSPTPAVAAKPCCRGTCSEPGMKKYWSIAHGLFGTKHCGECCMDPKKYNLYHFFEKNLTLSDQPSPCHAFGFTKYDSTVTHGFGPVKMTLDLYDKPSELLAFDNMQFVKDPVSCMKQKCPAQLTNCQKDAKCDALLGCLPKCKPGDKMCMKKCAASNIDGAVMEMAQCGKEAGCWKR